MSETIDEPGRGDEQYPDEQYGGTGQPDDDDELDDEPDDESDDEPESNDLERALDSVRDVEDG